MSFEFVVGPECGRHPKRKRACVGEPLSATSQSDLLGALAEWYDKTPDNDAFYFIDTNNSITERTYRQVWDNSRKVAAHLSQRGVAAQDRVFLTFETSPELLEAFIACQWIGAIPCIVDSSLSRGGYERFKVKQSILKPKAILGYEQFLTTLKKENSPDCILLNDFEILNPTTISFLPYQAHPEEICFIQFTSGTTSKPRGVCISHRALMANVGCIATQGKWHSQDIMVGWLPLFHDMGLVATTLSAFTHGIPTVLMSPIAFLLEPSRWLWAFHYFRATLAFSPNFGYQLCAKRKDEALWDNLDLSSWRNAYNAAEFIHLKTINDFTAATAAYGFQRKSVLPAYGLAEFVVGVTCQIPGDDLAVDIIDRAQLQSDELAIPIASDVSPENQMAVIGVGPVFENHACRIVNERGEDLGERRQGEILLRGPSLASGYFEDPLATAATFREGWLHTGDLGYRIGRNLFICGRTKDLIIRGGENVHPYQLELAAAHVEGVREGCVAAVSLDNTDTGTEDIMVVFETKVTDEVQVKELCRKVKERIFHETGMRPDHALAVRPRNIPKTSSGKIARRIVKEQLIPNLLSSRKIAVGAFTHETAK